MGLLITEQQKKDILGLYDLKVENYAITEALSLNENYAIFLDELYDIKNRKHLGNVWESMDNFKIFFNDSPDNLSEKVLEIRNKINSLVLVESKQSLQIIREHFLNEQLWDAWDAIKSGASDFGDWVYDQGKSAVQGTKDFANKVGRGIEQAYDYVTNDMIQDAMNLLGQGVLYIARSLRDALYHPVGMTLDAILIATGIGKSAQFVLWAVVVALDIYELSTGDYDKTKDSFYTKLLFMGVDMLGLVFAGVAAKGAKTIVGEFIRKFGKTAEGMKEGLKSSPAMKNIVQKISDGLGKVPAKLNEASTYLKSKSPKLYSWLSGIIGGVSKFIQKIVDFFAYLGAGAVKAAGAVLNVPTKIGTKAARLAGAGAQTSQKIGAATGAATIVGGTSYALGAGKNQPEFAVNFDDAKYDFSKGL